MAECQSAMLRSEGIHRLMGTNPDLPRNWGMGRAGSNDDLPLQDTRKHSKREGATVRREIELEPIAEQISPCQTQA